MEAGQGIIRKTRVTGSVGPQNTVASARFQGSRANDFRAIADVRQPHWQCGIEAGESSPLAIKPKTAVERFKIPFAVSGVERFALSEKSPAHGARRYQETGAVLSCLNDFSWRLSP